jgi:glyoxylase-like metal-dependent hydrolase (beta-lactamase superfamily II)
MQPTVLKRIFIQPTLLFKDNYSYLLKDLESGLSALIDPANVKAIPPDQSINMVLATHHHFDHVGELAQVVAKLGNIKVYGGDDRVPCLTDKAQADFHLGSLLITPISTPCHTSASICYFVQDSANSEYALFTGDTLFAAGYVDLIADVAVFLKAVLLICIRRSLSYASCHPKRLFFVDTSILPAIFSLQLV